MHLRHFHSIIEQYNGGIPLVHFLKNYFKQNPKLGSRDRKVISEMAYCWYRCSKGFDDGLAADEKLKVCLYICETGSKHILHYLPEAWQQSKHLTTQEKISLLAAEGIAFDISRIAPFTSELSEGIGENDWRYSMLRQPMLFIRIRKDQHRITDLLKENDIDYVRIRSLCIGMANGTKADAILPEDSYVVQDASSQYTGIYFDPQDGEQWWDCCSGAGGKSLLLKDLNSNIQLTVSDKRASILHNLKERFKLYHHKTPVAYTLDVADSEAVKKLIGDKRFDHIICDVPCTGSGTWARTPEQLYYFDEKLIKEISKLQASIVINAAAYLQKGKELYYITCSVFKEENEEVVNAVLENTDLQLKEIKLINGIHEKADSMFIAVLHRPA